LPDVVEVSEFTLTVEQITDDINLTLEQIDEFGTTVNQIDEFGVD